MTKFKLHTAVVLIVLFSSLHMSALASGNLSKSPSKAKLSVEDVITKQLRPTDDTYVYGRGGAETTNIRGLDDMSFLKSYYNGNRAWAYETYLKFDLSELNPDSAMINQVVLKLYGNDDAGKDHTINVFDMSGTLWDEDNLTYSTIAATGNKSLITSITSNMSTAKWYSWDITNYLKTKIKSGSKVVCLMLCDNATLKKADGTTNVIVSFHSKENASTYTPILEVTEKSNSDLLLNELKIDGQLISDFQSAKYSYTVQLPTKQNAIPVITATAIHANAVVTVRPATSLTGTLAERTTKISVTLNSQTQEYLVVFEKVLSNNSTKINSITVNGTQLEFFSKDNRNYTYNLPYTQNPTVNPVVIATAENPDQQISVLPAGNLKGTETERTATVRVKSSDETATADYKIVYQILPQLDLYLCIGQSNMSGRGTMVQALGDLNPISNTYLLTPGLNWEMASNPMNKYSNIRKELSVQQVSPAYGFALNLIGKTTNPVGMIVNARGGTSMAQWTKGSVDQLYENTLLRAKEAQKWGKIKAILWHQGESNSSSGAVATYPTEFKAMIDNFKADLNEPTMYVVAGELAYWRGGGTGSNAYNNMIRTISTFIPNSDYVSAEGLTPLIDATDPHFDRASNIELGKRYAQKVIAKFYALSGIAKNNATNTAKIRTDKKKVVFEDVLTDTSLKIYDVTGKLILFCDISNSTTYEATLKEGVYVVVLYGSNGIYRQKVIVK